ncbi:MAG: hypothetical protein AABZ47_15185, partial [Planctomycetota bacterium]
CASVVAQPFGALREFVGPLRVESCGIGQPQQRIYRRPRSAYHAPELGEAHGIGGALYDQVTDQVIQEFFHLEPPSYGCVSATVRLDLPVPAATLDDRRRMRRELRDMHWNGQRFLPKEPDTAEWIRKKLVLVNLAEQLRRERPFDHAARASAFRELRVVQEELRRFTAEAQERLRIKVTAVEEQLVNRAIATGREYFVGLFAREQLDRLCQALPDETAFRV